MRTREVEATPRKQAKARPKELIPAAAKIDPCVVVIAGLDPAIHPLKRIFIF
jgi:hypothetical protein